MEVSLISTVKYATFLQHVEMAVAKILSSYISAENILSSRIFVKVDLWSFFNY